MSKKTEAEPTETKEPKAKKEPKDKGPKPSLEVFEVVKIPRSMLTEAPYNPRLMSDKARQRLSKGIDLVGLVQPACVWNVRTGRIVGGHQRLKKLDNYYGGKEYELSVCRINVSPKREVEINLLLNNYEAQGEFDLKGLEELMKAEHDGEKLELEAAGFDTADAYRMFGDSVFDQKNAGDLQALGDKLKFERDKYTGIVEGSVNRDAQYFLVAVFKDATQLNSFLVDNNLDKVSFGGDYWCVNGEEIRSLIPKKATEDV